AFARKMEDIRVGYAPADFTDWAEPSARPAFEKALADIRAMGVKLVETVLPDFPYSVITDTVIMAECASGFEALIRRGKVDELADKVQIAGLKASLNISATDYLKAMRIRGDMKQAYRKLFADVDVLLSPTRYGPASKLGDALDKGLDRPRPQTRG